MFRVGQKVVCVDATVYNAAWGANEEPTVGKVYTVTGYGDSIFGNYPVIHVAESHNPLGYRASRFRPIVERETDISIFKAMLTPAGRKRETV